MLSHPIVCRTKHTLRKRNATLVWLSMMFTATPRRGITFGVRPKMILSISRADMFDSVQEGGL